MLVQATFIQKGFMVPPELQKRLDDHEDVSDASMSGFKGDCYERGPSYSVTVGWDLAYHRKEFASYADDCLRRGGTVITYRLD